MAEKEERDAEAYLARIRRTIAESNRLVEQASLRMAETDRMLESQGLTREQVMNFHFTAAQREAVNAELRRRGMEPLDDEEGSLEVSQLGSLEEDAGRETRDERWGDVRLETGDELAERQRKFGMMMKPFQI